MGPRLFVPQPPASSPSKLRNSFPFWRACTVSQNDICQTMPGHRNWGLKAQAVPMSPGSISPYLHAHYRGFESPAACIEREFEDDCKKYRSQYVPEIYCHHSLLTPQGRSAVYTLNVRERTHLTVYSHIRYAILSILVVGSI